MSDYTPIILIVDDNPVNRKVLELLVNHLGLNADSANGGKEAIEAIKSKDYSVVLMDVMMPELDGIEATKKIREFEFASGTRTPIIACTALDSETAEQTCLDAGMDDFITKPVRLEDLSERLKRWIQKPVGRLLREMRASIEMNQSKSSSLKLLCDNEEVEDIFKMFLTVTDALLTDLEAAISKRDLEGTVRVAHEIKGSSGTASAMEMAALARSLEVASRKQNWPEILKLYTALVIAFANVRDFIEDA